MRVVYTTKAEDHLKGLPENISDRILEKIAWYCQQEDPLKFAVALSGTKEKLYRFRIGNYRAIFMLQNEVPTIVMIIAVKHRSEAYK